VNSLINLSISQDKNSDFTDNRPTACVIGGRASVENVGERKELETRIILEKR